MMLIAKQIGDFLQQCNWKLATAESCTGGWVAQVVTSIAGSSAWFDRGFITYSNQAKMECLGVPAQILDEHGAVSEATAKAMVQGTLAHSAADVALSVTGIAGPDGGTADKPVGTVWFGWGTKSGEIHTALHQLTGDRQQIREQSVQIALQGLYLHFPQ